MIVGNRYELHDMVAQGAYGMVFRATDTRHEKPVAVKMLSGGAKQDPHVVERLVREQQALQALSGTNAVGAIDLCRAQTGALCLVMEWLDGIDMEQHLEGLEERGTRMATGDLLELLRPVLDTLAKAHELGIVHRDIKPANIFLLSRDQGVRLLDFGLSRLKSSATLTAVGMVMGSPSYMAPEAWKGNSKAIGRQADLYSVGVIVFRALTGKVPFDTEALVEKMRLVTTARRPSVRARRPDLPLVMDAWAERALAIDPAKRFQHASHFMESLEAALAGLPIPRHTFPSPSRGVTSIPPPRTTEEERENAVSAALSRAASLLKRFANSFSRAPDPAAHAREETSSPAQASFELPKPPSVPAPSSRERPPPVVPRAVTVSDKKTVELGDDDLVEWLLEDGSEENKSVEGPLDAAPSRIDAEVKAALTPPPPEPDRGIDESALYDEAWDEVTLPRAQRIAVEGETLLSPEQAQRVSFAGERQALPDADPVPTEPARDGNFSDTRDPSARPAPQEGLAGKKTTKRAKSAPPTVKRAENEAGQVTAKKVAKSRRASKTRKPATPKRKATPNMPAVKPAQKKPARKKKAASKATAKEKRSRGGVKRSTRGASASARKK